MAKVRVSNIVWKSSQGAFTDRIQLQFFIECVEPPMDEVEFKFVYVGCAEDSSYDQILEDIMVPIQQKGGMTFDVDMEGPDPAKIPTISDLLGVTVFMVCAFYRQKEFFRCSYFVHNTYIGEEDVNEEEFSPLRVMRSVLSDKPRIVLSEIDWNDELNKAYMQLIQLDTPDEVTTLRNANDRILNGFDDPFSVSENSFLGASMFIDPGQ